MARLQQELRPEDLKPTFERINSHLREKKQTAKVTVLGGVAILHYGYNTRVTNDIDIALKTPDAEYFIGACEELGIAAQIVTQTTTVDFNDAEKDTIFNGEALTVESIRPNDLIKSKLERFRKQDPEDIYAIIDGIGMTYDQFENLFEQMLLDYIGRDEMLKTSALIVVQTKYPEWDKDFVTTFKIRT